MSDLQDFIDRFFSEEFRIQQIVNDALYEQKQQHKIEIENHRKESEQKLKNQRIQMRDKYIVDLSVKLKMSPQEIAEFTENPIELVVEVLNSQKL